MGLPQSSDIYNMGKYHWSTELVEQLRQLILNHRNIIILPHTAPDGDALGSTLAWAKVLQAAHPEATYSCLRPKGRSTPT